MHRACCSSCCIDDPDPRTCRPESDARKSRTSSVSFALPASPARKQAGSLCEGMDRAGTGTDGEGTGQAQRRRQRGRGWGTKGHRESVTDRLKQRETETDSDRDRQKQG